MAGDRAPFDFDRFDEMIAEALDGYETQGAMWNAGDINRFDNRDRHPDNGVSMAQTYGEVLVGFPLNPAGEMSGIGDGEVGGWTHPPAPHGGIITFTWTQDGIFTIDYTPDEGEEG